MIFAVIGKGGVGKTTISSLLVRRLIQAGQTPVLAIDADPSSCLGPALGVEVPGTLGDLREGFRDDSQRPPSVTRSDWLALAVEELVAEQSGFDLLTMGRPEGQGCYCFVNNLLRDHLDRLSRSYRHVLLDCEAGLEHLSRRTTGKPDRLVCVTNRSRRGAETVSRALSLCLELHGRLPGRVDLVLNGFQEGEPLVEEMITLAAGNQTEFSSIWIIPRDEEVSTLEAAGESIFRLADTSTAFRALNHWESSL